MKLAVALAFLFFIATSSALSSKSRTKTRVLAENKGHASGKKHNHKFLDLEETFGENSLA